MSSTSSPATLAASRWATRWRPSSRSWWRFASEVRRACSRPIARWTARCSSRRSCSVGVDVVLARGGGDQADRAAVDQDRHDQPRAQPTREQRALDRGLVSAQDRPRAAPRPARRPHGSSRRRPGRRRRADRPRRSSSVEPAARIWSESRSGSQAQTALRSDGTSRRTASTTTWATSRALLRPTIARAISVSAAWALSASPGVGASCAAARRPSATALGGASSASVSRDGEMKLLVMSRIAHSRTPTPGLPQKGRAGSAAARCDAEHGSRS